jgi:hypothetical protein
MFPARLDPAIPASEGRQTYTIERVATESGFGLISLTNLVGYKFMYMWYIKSALSNIRYYV